MIWTQEPPALQVPQVQVAEMTVDGGFEEECPGSTVAVRGKTR